MVEVFLVRDVLGASPIAFGVLGAAFAVGAATGRPARGPRPRGSRVRSTPCSLACVVVSFMTLAAGLVTQLFVWAARLDPRGQSRSARFRRCAGRSSRSARPPSRAGQVFATVSASTRAASLVATALGGIAGTLMGPQGVFVAAGCGCLLATLVVGRRLRNAVRRPALLAGTYSPLYGTPNTGQAERRCASAATTAS